ncbi:hypothetical protein GQ43DRAFT_401013 [Delitschia confertaspora ATCC 74209]|uniref:Defects in morphology protein 1 n=1 Tax=Delitschia confertaspora ATCC 74209 TaxID=1513339 RepID=A0A9P4JJL7_9PLEO|nr:hypothetical protein GQ43DRAFT_401013 [Delitschia confertaspora ATCC 74209]
MAKRIMAAVNLAPRYPSKQSVQIHTYTDRVPLSYPDDEINNGMAVSAELGLTKVASSDYGSDFDSEGEIEIDTLLLNIAAGTSETASLTAVEKDASLRTSVQCDSGDNDALVAVVKLEETVPLGAAPRCAVSPRPAVEVEYDLPSRESWTVPAELSKDGLTAPTAPQPAPEDKNKRSPLQRFRTKPQKPLSVTDLVSLAWCELQYWFNLTKFGRKPQTTAMKRGSAVHKELEDQVHDTVEVRVATREDAFGLKLWNVIQGLRSLRMTGMTRELEVWGIIDGQLVSGIIDELSYACPDVELEKSLEEAEKCGLKTNSNTSLPHQIGNSQDLDTGNIEPWLSGLGPDRKVYITDDKTRGVKSVPSGEYALRPTYMQLMLYRKLLASLADNAVDAEFVFSRHNLNSLQPFSPLFINEVSAIDFNFREDSPPEGASQFSNPYAAVGELAAHKNLSALWSLMISEFQRTIPNSSISKILQAEYRYARTGEIIGNKLFAYDESVIEAYISRVMSWWKGDREAKGVDIEEAFKCHSCTFADICTWRKAKVEEATEKQRLRNSRATSKV